MENKDVTTGVIWDLCGVFRVELASWREKNKVKFLRTPCLSCIHLPCPPQTSTCAAAAAAAVTQVFSKNRIPFDNQQAPNFPASGHGHRKRRNERRTADSSSRNEISNNLVSSDGGERAERSRSGASRAAERERERKQGHRSILLCNVSSSMQPGWAI